MYGFITFIGKNLGEGKKRFRILVRERERFINNKNYKCGKDMRAI